MTEQMNLYAFNFVRSISVIFFSPAIAVSYTHLDVYKRQALCWSFPGPTIHCLCRSTRRYVVVGLRDGDGGRLPARA